MEEELRITSYTAGLIGSPKAVEEAARQRDLADRAYQVATEAFNSQCDALAYKCEQFRAKCKSWTKQARHVLEDLPAVQRKTEEGIQEATPEMALFSNLQPPGYEKISKEWLEKNPTKHLVDSPIAFSDPLSLSKEADVLPKQISAFFALHGCSLVIVNVKKAAEEALKSDQFGTDAKNCLNRFVELCEMHATLLNQREKILEECSTNAEMKQVKSDYFKAARTAEAWGLEASIRQEYQSDDVSLTQPNDEQKPSQGSRRRTASASPTVWVLALAWLGLLSVGFYRLWRSSRLPSNG